MKVDVRTLPDGTIIKTYVMIAGEEVPPGPHQHPFSHTTEVLAGSAKVTIEGASDEFIGSDRPRILLPANIDHNIIALETPTIVMNIQHPNSDAPVAVTHDHRPGQSGRVMMHGETSD